MSSYTAGVLALSAGVSHPVDRQRRGRTPSIDTQRGEQALGWGSYSRLCRFESGPRNWSGGRGASRVGNTRRCGRPPVTARVGGCASGLAAANGVRARSGQNWVARNERPEANGVSSAAPRGFEPLPHRLAAATVTQP